MLRLRVWTEKDKPNNYQAVVLEFQEYEPSWGATPENLIVTYRVQNTTVGFGGKIDNTKAVEFLRQTVSDRLKFLSEQVLTMPAEE